MKTLGFGCVIRGILFELGERLLKRFNTIQVHLRAGIVLALVVVAMGSGKVGKLN